MILQGIVQDPSLGDPINPLSLPHSRGWLQPWSTTLMSFHWGGFLMALNANLRIFACDSISHGAPRGWVTSAPGAERFFFFFPLEAPACGIM